MKSLIKNFVFVMCIFISFGIIAQTNNSEKAKSEIQNKGELYFSFNINNSNTLQALSKNISITKYDNTQKKVWAFANKKGFDKFLSFNFNYDVLKNPGVFDIAPKMMKSLNVSRNVDSYPIYPVYVEMMENFASTYPDICKLYNIGTSVQGRSILFLKITQNVSLHEPEPRFMYTSSMHGNEGAGYIFMLRYIEMLLSSYNADANITRLINNAEIWINPLANPDGMYAGGDSTVDGATRFNANNIDLNRNYPDFVDGEHPDGNLWQKENIAMIHLVDSVHFVMSANMHTGAEVVNYPWDTYEPIHADDVWWQYVARNYADAAQNNDLLGYFDDQNNGITNGYAWYTINGGRQDYMNYYQHCREFTLEHSRFYMPNENTFDYYWGQNKDALLNYNLEVLNGFKGIITDSLSCEPLAGKIFIENHDNHNSFVLSELPFGDYYRPINQGVFTVTYSADGYYPKTKTIQIFTDSCIVQNVQLVKDTTQSITKIENFNLKIYPNPAKDIIYFVNTKSKIVEVKIYNLKGQLVYNDKLYDNSISLNGLNKGLYFLKIIEDKESTLRKFIIE